jgi:hypothetical protein
VVFAILAFGVGCNNQGAELNAFGPLLTCMLEPAIGAAVMLVTLADVFLTVLYARAGAGVISARLARIVWSCFKVASKPFPRIRPHILSFGGPAIVVSLFALWALGLALGAALIIHPHLGQSVLSQSGSTPTDFISALYAGGNSVSVIGASSFVPTSTPLRAVYLFNSLVGLAVTSLSLTYMMQVYSALHRRNSLAFTVHLAANQTADAAELIAGLGSQGSFDRGYSQLSEIATELAAAKEYHHFYPLLFYFRFDDAFYSVSRFTLVLLDAVTLMKTALDDEQYRWLKTSSALVQLWGGAIALQKTLSTTFVPSHVAGPGAIDAGTQEIWRRRYRQAVARLQQAGIRTTTDERTGAAAYELLRSEWDFYIRAMAPELGYSKEDIDHATATAGTAQPR